MDHHYSLGHMPVSCGLGRGRPRTRIRSFFCADEKGPRIKAS